jgi:hypothetical protein
MSRVGDELRRDQAARSARMTAAERLAEALRLGQDAIAAFAAAHGVTPGEARCRLERAGQAGRRPSAVMRELVG